MGSRGTIRSSRGFAIFRIIFGLLFIGFGFDTNSRAPADNHRGYFTIAIGVLFLVYGIMGFLSPKTLGSKVEADARPVSERLDELTRLKTEGQISEQEFEAKRKDIINNL